MNGGNQRNRLQQIVINQSKTFQTTLASKAFSLRNTLFLVDNKLPTYFSKCPITPITVNAYLVYPGTIYDQSIPHYLSTIIPV